MANKRIYLCLAHMSDEGLEQKYIQEAFDTNWVKPGDRSDVRWMMAEVCGERWDGFSDLKVQSVAVQSCFTNNRSLQ